ncbi:MAG: hypothetical protein AAFZ65_05425 [Planctomycetota bacterium]
MNPPSADAPPARPQLPSLIGLAAISFLVMFAYAAARPVRDEIAANITSADRADLWKWTFVANLLLAPVYAWFASRSTRSRLLAGVFAFFSLSALGFAFLAGALRVGDVGYAGLEGAPRLAMESVFYVWLSVFVMLVVSATWSLASDLVRTDGAKRLFGPIAAATSLGGIAGAFVTAQLSEAEVGPGPVFVLVSVSLLLACVPLFQLERWIAGTPGGGSGSARIGGTAWSGLVAVARSRYLLAIAGFILLMTLSSTVVYFTQAELLGGIEDRNVRRAFNAKVDLGVNVASLAVQLGVVGWLMRRTGLGLTLAALPAIAALGLVGLWLLSGRVEGGEITVAEVLLPLGLLLGAQRVGRYAFARPAREALYTLVTRDERYKSKSFLDTAVYRGGDVVWGEAYASLQGGLGLGVAAIAIWAVPVMGLWLLGALWLGTLAERRRARLAAAAG